MALLLSLVWIGIQPYELMRRVRVILYAVIRALYPSISINRQASDLAFLCIIKLQINRNVRHNSYLHTWGKNYMNSNTGA
jgi:hypothetical protein